MNCQTPHEIDEVVKVVVYEIRDEAVVLQVPDSDASTGRGDHSVSVIFDTENRSSMGLDCSNILPFVSVEVPSCLDDRCVAI